MFFITLHIIVTVLLIASILLQTTSGTIAGVFGGSGTAVRRSKRGLEKFLFTATIILGISFLILSVVSAMRA